MNLHSLSVINVKMSTTQHTKFLLFFFMCIYFCVGPQVSLANTSRCEFYNSTLCRDQKQSCAETQVCDLPDHGKRNHCFVLWQYHESNHTTEVKMKGCFLDNRDCYDQERCVGSHKSNPGKKELYFCCCQGDLCNRQFARGPQLPPATVLTPQQNSPKLMVQPASDQAVTTVLYTIVPVLGFLAFGIAIFYWIYRRKKLAYFNEIPTMDLHCQSGLPPSPVLELRPIQLQEIKARGRFGAVWKAQYKSETVAVKIFPMQDKQSWLSEQEIFKLPHMDHSNILAYIGVEKRGDNLQAEFWLITAYHERGSLCDYLKANTVTWTECCLIVETMARGLMHLHEEVQPNKTDGYKPAVAHRDFKSKNVLLKWDLSACIADFGLALVFQPGTTCGDTHGQVGTRRYMAPEVLEGAITFSRDAFLRIDMYAFGLVLWEVASRCSAAGAAAIADEYQPPFHAEVADHPTLEDIQACVVDRKQRPAVADAWRKHMGMCVLCDTMEECWDHDAEARLSASCVVERVAYQCPRYKDVANA